MIEKNPQSFNDKKKILNHSMIKKNFSASNHPKGIFHSMREIMVHIPYTYRNRAEQKQRERDRGDNVTRNKREKESNITLSI